MRDDVPQVAPTLVYEGRAPGDYLACLICCFRVCWAIEFSPDMFLIILAIVMVAAPAIVLAVPRAGHAVLRSSKQWPGRPWCPYPVSPFSFQDGPTVIAGGIEVLGQNTNPSVLLEAFSKHYLAQLCHGGEMVVK